MQQLEDLLQKFVHLHILESVPASPLSSDLQEEQMYKWNFSRVSVVP